MGHRLLRVRTTPPRTRLSLRKITPRLRDDRLEIHRAARNAKISVQVLQGRAQNEGIPQGPHADARAVPGLSKISQLAGPDQAAPARPG
mmetsp:Transcript_13724/g.19789  ORF Transcript_13724/g.19789 Transcript_13724/m.19789 type:complete len:89 (-) Transcript_13724:59-325(-)